MGDDAHGLRDLHGRGGRSDRLVASMKGEAHGRRVPKVTFSTSQASGLDEGDARNGHDRQRVLAGATVDASMNGRAQERRDRSAGMACSKSGEQPV